MRFVILVGRSYAGSGPTCIPRRSFETECCVPSPEPTEHCALVTRTARYSQLPRRVAKQRGVAYEEEGATRRRGRTYGDEL